MRCGVRVEASSPKKCRARYGLENQHEWCKPCRRKKKCIKFGGGDDCDEHETDAAGGSGDRQGAGGDRQRGADSDGDGEPDGGGHSGASDDDDEDGLSELDSTSGAGDGVERRHPHPHPHQHQHLQHLRAKSERERDPSAFLDQLRLLTESYKPLANGASGCAAGNGNGSLLQMTTSANSQVTCSTTTSTSTSTSAANASALDGLTGASVSVSASASASANTGAISAAASVPQNGAVSSGSGSVGNLQQLQPLLTHACSATGLNGGSGSRSDVSAFGRRSLSVCESDADDDGAMSECYTLGSAADCDGEGGLRGFRLRSESDEEQQHSHPSASSGLMPNGHGAPNGLPPPPFASLGAFAALALQQLQQQSQAQAAAVGATVNAGPVGSSVPPFIAAAVRHL